jgi:hypothetical protein
VDRAFGRSCLKASEIPFQRRYWILAPLRLHDKRWRPSRLGRLCVGVHVTFQNEACGTDRSGLAEPLKVLDLLQPIGLDLPVISVLQTSAKQLLLYCKCEPYNLPQLCATGIGAPSV